MVVDNHEGDLSLDETQEVLQDGTQEDQDGLQEVQGKVHVGIQMHYL